MLCPPPLGNISAEGGRNPTNGSARGDGGRNNKNETGWIEGLTFKAGGGNPLGTMTDDEGEGSVCEQDKRGKGRTIPGH